MRSTRRSIDEDGSDRGPPDDVVEGVHDAFEHMVQHRGLRARTLRLPGREVKRRAARADRCIMLMSTDDAFDEYLVKDAQAAATQWGADRFAEEFARRDEEERRLRDAEAGIFFRYPGLTYPDDEPDPAMMTGPVDESVSDRVIETAVVATVEIRKPKPIRHAHVPRPPAQDQDPGPRRSWRRRGQDRAPRGSWVPSEAELARMSAAGRRLYGVDGGNDVRPTS